MRWLFTILLLGFSAGTTIGQEVNQHVLEQQIETLTESTESETEDDSYQQQLQHFRKSPLNLNNTTESDLRPFRFLSELQVQNFLSYRRLLGNLLSVYELQAVPAWDIETIAKLLPFIKVGPAESVLEALGHRFVGGTHTILFRASQTLEKSRGFLPKDSASAPVYPGSPQRLFLRYKYVYKNLLQFGFLGEKDPGEQFFKGAQKNGFDFYSLHLFVRNLGVVKRLAVGDFTLNLGQGLLTYQSLAFRKSVDVMNIKRQTEVFRPYNSATEANFMRGAAITVGSDKLNFSVFAARQKISANAVVDSVNYEDYISSILTNGLHRTASEVADKNNITQTALGGRLAYRNGRLQTAINALHYQLSKPLQKADEPYNKYAFSGSNLTGVSAEYAYTWRNMHFFGEVATNPAGGGNALVSGVMASLDPRVDVSLLFRSISKDYHSINASAFTEGTTPVNERGLFAGIAIRPATGWRIDAYADIFSFPWLKYRVDRPSEGSEYTVQLTWKPNKQVELYSRYRNEQKAINLSGTDLAFHQTENIPRQNWRTHFSYKISPAVTLRARTEIMWYDAKGKAAEEGFLLFADVVYKPPMNPLSFNCRVQYFETDGYNSRLYAFENDVLYSYSIPLFYGKGYRGYVNLNYDISKNVSAWFRVARTFYPGGTRIGSGYDEISGSHKTDCRVQLMITL